jgi:plasmid stabilization system protein ParE
MKYTVVWRPTAEDELAEIWLHCPDRRAVTNAAHRLERALSGSPEIKGQEFHGDRLLVDDPLAVIFTVDPGDRKVQILSVWHR